jgi:hypothetical protein
MKYFALVLILIIVQSVVYAQETQRKRTSIFTNSSEPEFLKEYLNERMFKKIKELKELDFSQPSLANKVTLDKSLRFLRELRILDFDAKPLSIVLDDEEFSFPILG